MQLAGLAGIDVKMTSEVVRRLEAKQLLRRVADPSDARAKVIEVTPSGADAARRAIEIVEAADADFFAAAQGPRLMTLCSARSAASARRSPAKPGDRPTLFLLRRKGRGCA